MVRVKLNFLQRVRGILFAPRTEWPAIEREFTEPAFLFVRYAALLALVPAAADFIGRSVIGVRVSAGLFHEPVVLGLAKAATGYLLSFVIVYLIAIAINLLSPRFGGRRHFMSALKLSIYGYTPVWFAGIFLALPGLRFLTLLSLYGGYLLWTGLPVLLGVPARRAGLFAALIVVVGIVLTILLGLTASLIFLLPENLG